MSVPSLSKRIALRGAGAISEALRLPFRVLCDPFGPGRAFVPSRVQWMLVGREADAWPYLLWRQGVSAIHSNSWSSSKNRAKGYTTLMRDAPDGKCASNNGAPCSRPELQGARDQPAPEGGHDQDAKLHTDCA